MSATTSIAVPLVGTSLRLPVETHTAAKARAHDEHLSFNTLVTKALEAYLAGPA